MREREREREGEGGRGGGREGERKSEMMLATYTYLYSIWYTVRKHNYTSSHTVKIYIMCTMKIYTLSVHALYSYPASNLSNKTVEGIVHALSCLR